MKTNVAVMKEIGKIEIEERTLAEPKDNEVIVKVEYCGVCGSDIHYYEHGKIGDFVVTAPIVLGHEAAGVVVETGKKVQNIKIGDRVTIEPGHTCGTCEFCRSGKYNLCPDVVFMATPPYDGAFAEYVVYPSEWVYRLPDTMDTMEGALVEPFSVGLHAVRQSGAQAGKSAAILGSGCIGLCTLLALSASGVKEIYVADVIQKRLDMATELGAVQAINARDENTVEKIMELTEGKGVDLVFETAGSEITAKQTVDLVAKGGCITMVGMAADPNYRIDFGKLQGKEAHIQTVFRYRNLYPTAIQIIDRCKLPLKKIATDMYSFRDTAKALEDSVNKKAEMVKTVIRF